MEADFVPIMVVPAVPYQGGVRFSLEDGQIELAEEDAETVWRILLYADGRHTVPEIVGMTGLPEEDVREILEELQKMGVIVDARQQYLHFHRVSNYPTDTLADFTDAEVFKAYKRAPAKEGTPVGYTPDTGSELFALRRERRSCRCFSKRKMTVDQIGNMCNFAYSIHDHAVPSGGALYPLRIFVLIEEAQYGLEPGYYEYDPEKNWLVLYDKRADLEQLKYCYDLDEMPFGSAVQVVLAADLTRQGLKYANRGYRLTLLEAGHAAENICLYAVDHGLATCELGGVLDRPLKRELQLEREMWPLLVIAVGYAEDVESTSLEAQARKKRAERKLREAQFVQEHVGPEHPVTGVYVRALETDVTFFAASATYHDKMGCVEFAGATGTMCADAMFKATMEAYERWAASQVRVDLHGSVEGVMYANTRKQPYHGLRKWVEPNEIVPLSPGCLRKCGLTPFDKRLAIDWVRGVNYDGQEIYVPTDLVFYGHRNEENRIYYANSSGVAADFDFARAKFRAVTELVERDAVMRNWFQQKSPPVVPKKLLPIHVQKRMEYWEKRQRKMMVLALQSEYGRVYEVIVVSEEFPCFVSGAAAVLYQCVEWENLHGAEMMQSSGESQLGTNAGQSRDDLVDGRNRFGVGSVEQEIEKAILKATAEAEYSLALALRHPDTTPIEPSAVRTPADHGRVYHFRENAEKIRWLWSGSQEVESLGELVFEGNVRAYHPDTIVPPMEFERYCWERLRLVTVTIREEPVKVVRVLSPTLVPISFGFGMAHYLMHQRLLRGDFSYDSLKMPHYFA